MSEKKRRVADWNAVPMSAAERREMDEWIDAELAKAPPLTKDKVRRILAAAGVRAEPA